MSETPLSGEQIRIINNIVDDVSHNWSYRGGLGDGPIYFKLRRMRGASRSEHASRSRALRRLEARGLVSRWNGVGGNPDPDNPDARRGLRSTCVTLTDLGVAVAERLTSKPVGEMLTALREKAKAQHEAALASLRRMRGG